MSVTAQQVFEIAMTLIDEVKNDGTLDTSKTASYKAKVPSILNIAQYELIKEGNIYKSKSTTVVLDDDWTTITMESDFKSSDQIIKVDTDSIDYNILGSFRWENPNKLLIPPNFEGTIKVIYRPVPVLITATTDTLSVDDVTAVTMLPYFLSSHLLLEENPALSNFYLQRFTENKINRLKNPGTFVKIQDNYGYCD